MHKLHGQLSFKILFCFILYFHRDISKLVSTVKSKQEFWDIRGNSEPYGLSCLFYEIFPRYDSQRSVLSYLRKVHQSYFLRSSCYRPLSVSGIIIIINTRPTSTSRGFWSKPRNFWLRSVWLYLSERVRREKEYQGSLREIRSAPPERGGGVIDRRYKRSD